MRAEPISKGPMGFSLDSDERFSLYSLCVFPLRLDSKTFEEIFFYRKENLSWPNSKERF